MIIVERTVVVDTPVERAYTYLADFETNVVLRRDEGEAGLRKALQRL